MQGRIVHGVDYGLVAARGAVVGGLASVVALAFALGTEQLASSHARMWSFPELLSSLVLRDGPAAMTTAFSATQFLTGAGLFLLLGMPSGAALAVTVKAGDVDDTIAGLLLGALLWPALVFFPAWLILAHGVLVHPLSEQPLVVAFWSYVVFGSITGSVMASLRPPIRPDRRSTRFVTLLALAALWLVTLVPGATAGFDLHPLTVVLVTVPALILVRCAWPPRARPPGHNGMAVP